ncbi:MAG: T9SS type A sorting domain-containing protein [Bacteroidota bacterium]|nr:T9SS type A sorting domain-containing protein [Bacteroidota bacterium]
MLGKKVYNTATNGENRYSINVGGLPKGLYVLSVGSEMIKVVTE